MSAVTVRVPAKVNVQLAVGAARPDGFHDLANVFLAVGLYDEVTATPSPGGLRITCDGPDAAQVPLDRTNLAARAAVALADRYGRTPDVHLHIAKDIPVAGGMAGGSADGAGALLACDTLWGTGATREELLDICAELGSDVPFSLVGGAALGTGRGEKLTELEVGGTFHWVFAMASRGLSTPAVFREFDRLAEGREIPEPVASQLRALAGFHDARYALIPVEVRFEAGSASGTGRGVLRMAILDVRGSRLVFIGDIQGPDLPDYTPTLGATLARRFADLVVP